MSGSAVSWLVATIYAVNTQVAVTVISVSGTLGSAIITFSGVALLQGMKSRREDRADRSRILAELLAAAMSLATAIDLFRDGWVVGPSLAERVLKPPRRAMVDLDAILVPKFDRFTRAAIPISMWPTSTWSIRWRLRRANRGIKEKVRRLTDAGGALTEAMAAKDEEYKKRQTAFQDALRELRHAIDGRKVGKKLADAPPDVLEPPRSANPPQPEHG